MWRKEAWQLPFFFSFVRWVFCQMWRTEKAHESQERVIYGPLHGTMFVIQQWYLGYCWKLSAYLLFAFVSHFIQHWCLSATCCIHQWSSCLTYKMLAFFSQSIYSHKDSGVIAASSDVFSAGFCKFLQIFAGNQSWPQPISQSELQNKCNVRAMYQFQWGQVMSCLSRHRMRSQYFRIWSCGTKWPAGIT